MLKYLVFEDEITLYWDRIKTLTENEKFIVLRDGKPIGETKKTHFEMLGLTSETTFDLQVVFKAETGDVSVGKEKIVTKPTPTRLDVSKPPYNAVGDGVTINTKALQKALDDANEGVCVYVPAGVYLTGGLFVRSNTYLYIDKDATIQGTGNYKDYEPKIKSRFEGIERTCYQSLLNVGELDHTKGYTTQNVVIRGGGKLIGGGKELCFGIIERERELLKEYLETIKGNKEIENSNTVPGRARGRLIQASNVDGLVLSDVYLSNGPSWNVHFIYSKNVITSRCTIHSHGTTNGDGWDPDSSEDCTIFNTRFETSDDCIAIKSGKNPEGNIINRPTKNIKVFDCYAVHGHALAMGSEMSGGIDGVTVWDVDMSGACWGFSVKTIAKRGGYVKNVSIYDSIMSRVSFSSLYRCNLDGEPAPDVPFLGNYRIENVTLTGENYYISPDGEKFDEDVAVIELAGFDKPGHEIQNVSIVDCKILKHPKGKLPRAEILRVKNLEIKNLTVE
ncbi:MAG: glycoside hydrolase family 28 protein [Clostridia bacterium]|nr:glycoside hydrolase family 28 protein [Clostridia bacterium]